MALSETMSGSNDWFQIYQQNFPATQVVASVSDAVAVTAASASTAQGSVGIPNSSLANTIANNSLSPEGKIAKPVRRRSRASRRTPTTLLNTDTTNFRAMVQQFTGDPSAPFAVSRMPNLGFNAVGAARQAQVINPSTAAMVTPSFHLQHQHLYQQQHHHHHQQQQNQYMFSMNNNSKINHGGRVDHFNQRISNVPNPTTITTRPSNTESSMTNHGGGRFFPSSSSS